MRKWINPECGTFCKTSGLALCLFINHCHKKTKAGGKRKLQSKRHRVLQNKKGNWKKVHLGGKKHMGIFSIEGTNPTLQGKNHSKARDEVR